MRAPRAACTRSNSGVHRAVSSSEAGENATSTVGASRRQRQTLNRGASTAAVPNRVCSLRVLRHLIAQHARLQLGQKRLPSARARQATRPQVFEPRGERCVRRLS